MKARNAQKHKQGEGKMTRYEIKVEIEGIEQQISRLDTRMRELENRRDELQDVVDNMTDSQEALF